MSELTWTEWAALAFAWFGMMWAAYMKGGAVTAKRCLEIAREELGEVADE